MRRTWLLGIAWAGAAFLIATRPIFRMLYRTRAGLWAAERSVALCRWQLRLVARAYSL